jgi:GcrA cell cycle regulator
MAWTDERVELLKKLWAEGLSASQIAGRLGGAGDELALVKPKAAACSCAAAAPHAIASVRDARQHGAQASIRGRA